MGGFERSGTRMSRRWGRWLRTPATLLTVLAVGVVGLVLLVPGGRLQVALSVSRVPNRYLELYFPADQHRPRCGAGRPVMVRFWLVSHLSGTEQVRYVVRETSAHSAGRPATGRVHLAPGGRAQVVRTVTPLPSRGARIVVDLPGRTEQLSLQCQRATAGRRR